MKRIMNFEHTQKIGGHANLKFQIILLEMMFIGTGSSNVFI